MLSQKFERAMDSVCLHTSSILVALSGGADSVCLLHCAAEYAKAKGLTVYASHVNHNIRTLLYNNEALRDENFCRELCRRLGVQLFLHSADIPALCKDSGESTETVARRVRYGFFAEDMKEHGIKILLTAHNADDNLETQIFNLCRGCGISGISGIPRLRDFPEAGGVVFRPLLEIKKSDILLYCKENSLSFVTDSTNLSDDYTRNRIRHKIIPELEDMFGSPQDAGCRLSVSSREDDSYIQLQADRICQSFVGSGIPLDIFNSLHVSLKRRILCRYYGGSLETVHQNDLINLSLRAVAHSSISLPDKKRAVIEDGCLIFTAEAKEIPAEYNIDLSLGFNKIPGCNFGVMICVGDAQDVLKIDGEIYKLYTQTHIKNDKISVLSARNRKEGDSIVSGGMTKKVKKLLCDKKIPLNIRKMLPIITCGDELVYVPMCAVNDSYISKNKNQPTIAVYMAER